MATQGLIRFWGFLASVLMLGSCGSVLHFATNESHLINRLEKGGDFQVQASASTNLASQQIYQAEAAVAFAPHLAIRAGLLTGGDFKWGVEKWGSVQARHIGVGGFYKIDNTIVSGSSWLGYSQGTAFNENPRYAVGQSGSAWQANAVNPAIIATFNDFSRFFMEQQITYKVQGIEFFGSLILGRSRITNLRYEGELPPNSGYANQYYSLMGQPQSTFAVAGLGISGGSPNLRVQLRFDQWLGPGAQQISPLYPTFISTSFSWRLRMKP